MSQSYPRRAQLRYTVWAWSAYAGGGLAVADAAIQRHRSLAASGPLLAVASAALGAGIAWSRRAARYGVGARSERVVADRLRSLEGRGWVVCHSVVWRGRGDIDHVVQSPGILAFAIETKTSRYDHTHLARTREAALHLDPYWQSCVPVLCLARRSGVCAEEQGVQVVSADRLVARLSELAGRA